MKFRILFTTQLFVLFVSVSVSFGYQINFTPTLSAKEEYTDNLFLSKSNTEHDFLTTVSSGFLLSALTQTSGVDLAYTPSYVFYDRFSELDTWRHSGRFRGWNDFSRYTRMELQNDFLMTEEPITDDDITRSEGTGPDPLIKADRNRRSREKYYTNEAQVRLTHQFGERDSVFAAHRYSILRYDKTKDKDNDIHSPSVGLTYWFTHQWGIDTGGSYSNRNYKAEEDREQWSGRVRVLHELTRQFQLYAEYIYTNLNYEENTVDYQIHEPSIGFAYNVDENTRVSLGGGYYFQDFESGDDESGYILNSDIEKKWIFRRGSIGLTGASGFDVEDSGSENLGFHIYYTAAGKGVYEFARDLSGNIKGSYRWDDYPDKTPERTDKTISAGAGLGYQALRWMLLALDYTFRNVDSTDREKEYQENRVTFTVTLSPEQPFRLN